LVDRTVGIIGLGIMGGAIARNLVERGWTVIGFDVDPARRSELARSGVTIVDDVNDVARRVRVIMTSLSSADAANVVAQQIVDCGQPPQIVIELSTLKIADKLRFKTILEAAGHIALDCPLSGTGAQAVTRDLVVYASGDSAAISRCLDLFYDFAKHSADLGVYGNGSRMKFIANHLVTIHNLAAAEAIVLGEMAGLDPGLVFDVIGDSAGSSRMFQIHGPMMVRGQYDEPTATMTTHLKDLDIIGKFAADLHCPTPLFATATQFYHAGIAQGRGGHDTGAVCAVLEQLAGITPRG